MDKIFWLIPEKLAGRTGPSMDPWDLKAFRENGIHAICSLDSDVDSAAIKKAGLKHLEHYIPSVCPLSSDLVSEFVHKAHIAVKQVLALMEQNSPVIVHCFAGKDRTGLVLCAALIHLEGISAQEAMKRVRAVRPIALTAPGMVETLWEYENMFKAGALD